MKKVGVGVIGRGVISGTYLKAATGFPILDIRGLGVWGEGDERRYTAVWSTSALKQVVAEMLLFGLNIGVNRVARLLCKLEFHRLIQHMVVGRCHLYPIPAQRAKYRVHLVGGKNEIRRSAARLNQVNASSVRPR